METKYLLLIGWFATGLINYGIKYSNFKEDWKKPENIMYKYLVLVGALLFGPVGLILTLNSRGKPYKK